MPDPGPRQLAALAAHIDGLGAAVEGLEADPGIGVSVRRIARSLESAAKSVGATEIAAGAGAIQKASDSQLARSVRIFLDRVEELRAAVPEPDQHVLVVEDNRTVAAATAGYLKARGRTIHHAFTAREALDVLTEHAMDAVVLDLILPDRDGRDLLVHMREQAATASIPVVVLSARGGSVARAECAAVGADDFIEKPAEPAALRAAVKRVLRRSALRRGTDGDGSTGLLNRVGTAEEFERIVADGGGDSLSVAVVGIDALDDVAEVMGGDAADHFVLEVASAIRATLGPRDALGRWERGELVILLPGRTPPEAESFVRETIQRLSLLEGRPGDASTRVEPTFRGGYAEAGNGTLHEVISAAERGMYAATAGSAHETSDEGPGRHVAPTVLLVEDDRVTATLIRHRLVRDGYEVHDFMNGEDAFAWAGEGHFDLAILDVKVPGMDGFELLAQMRRVERLAEVPIIMLTGMGSEADVIRGLELGADDYMLKPFSPTELLARVRRLIHANGPGETEPSRRRVSST